MKVSLEIRTETDKFLHLEIDPLVETKVKVEIGEIITIETTADQITEIDPEANGTIKGQVIGSTIIRPIIDEVRMDKFTDKTSDKHLETEGKVGMELKITMIIRGVEVEIEIVIDQSEPDKPDYLMGEMGLGPDPTLG